AAHAFLPKILRHHRHIGALFFFWEKISAPNRLHAEDIEVVRRHLAAEKLDGIAQPGQSERNNVFTGEPVENLFARAEMLKARHRDRELEQIALPGIRIYVQDAPRLLKWQSAQKEIIDQTENGSVQSDPQRQRDKRQQSEPGRLE